MKRTRRSVTLFSSLLFLVVSPAAPLEWPVDDLVLTATFGESRWEHFHSGIDIGGGAQEVRPIEAGEIVFVHDREDLRTGAVPTGLGSFIVVEHARGIRSLYAHLEPGTLPRRDTTRVGSDDRIGIIGDSGASYGKHLHLEITDTETGGYVNPLLLLPSLTDTRSPVIQSISLERGEGTVVRLDGSNRIESGSATVLIESYDPSEHVEYFCPMAPYQIIGFLNGSQVFNVLFESLNEEDGSLVLGEDGRPAFSDLFGQDWVFRVGEVTFNPGEATLEVVVRDVAGNESVARTQLTVN